MPYRLHLKITFYSSYYKYIIDGVSFICNYIAWLETPTRKYAFKYKKNNKIIKKTLKNEKLIESQKWSMDKFVINNTQNTTQNLDHI